jgi:hypothetical protein
MAKSRRASKSKNRRKGGGVLSLAILIVLALGLGAVGYQYFSPDKKDQSFASRRVPGGEKRPTLDPALFTGDVARAYQVAREIPQVLDQLYCHCQCIENSGHLSNLSCFVDRHGAG